MRLAMSHKRLPIVSQQYGRPSKDLSKLDIKPRSLHFFRCTLYQGGFDSGGAKWDPALPLYGVYDGEEYLAFIQAESKLQAALELGIDPSWLRYLDLYIPIARKGSMFWVYNGERKPIGFATTFALAVEKLKAYCREHSLQPLI